MVTLEQFSEIVGGCDIATFEMIRAQAKRKLAVIIERFGDENGARLKDDYLIEIMVMETPLLPGGIVQMEISVVFIQVAFAARCYGFLCHNLPIPPIYSYNTAFFAMFQAQNAIYPAILIMYIIRIMIHWRSS